MTARTTLGQLCAALSDSQSRPDVMQPGFEPGTVVTHLALRCSALDRCATRVPNFFNLRMMEATLFLGPFNAAEIVWYLSPDLWDMIWKGTHLSI